MIDQRTIRKNTSARRRNSLALAMCSLLVSGLAACGDSTNEMNVFTTSGPSVWTEDQKKYLSTVFDAALVSSNFFSEEAYVELGTLVCASFEKDQSTKTVMSVIISAGRANGLPEQDRMPLATTVMAAAVTYLCPTQLAKIAE